MAKQKGKSGPTYPPEFRRRMVELVRSGRTPEALAREFEPTAQSIRTWVRQADLGVHGANDLTAVALALNTRPRKILGWRTPGKAPEQFLRSAQTDGVASTD
jgi:transposase-like protein